MRRTRTTARYWSEIVWYVWILGCGLIAAGGALGHILGYGSTLGVLGL